MQLSHRLTVATLSTLLALGLSACGSDSGGGGALSEGSPTVSFAEPSDSTRFTTKGTSVDIPVIVQANFLAETDRIEMYLDDLRVKVLTANETAFTYENVVVGTHLLVAQVTDAIGNAYPGTGARASIQVSVVAVACESDAECDDDDECTADSCTDDGACENQAIPGCGAPTGCKNDADCADEGPAGVCRQWSCNTASGACEQTAAADGAACSDDNACTTADSCQAGACVGGPALSCDDAVACTTDTCDPADGCKNTPDDGFCDDDDPCTDDTCGEAGCQTAYNTAPCVDGSACTSGDACKDGVCAGTEKSCDDGNVCTTDTCDAGTGACANVASDGPCDDGNACTTDDACSGAACAGTAADCDDGVACTVDSCAPATGCVHVATDALCDDGVACTLETCSASAGCLIKTDSALCNDENPCTDDQCTSGGCSNTPNTAPCNDANACTAGDVCSGGACQSGTNTCQCLNDGDCAAFEDGNACNGTLVCEDNACVLDPTTVVSCSPSTQACQVTSCNPATGGCDTNPVPDGTACSDNNACTAADVCQGGACAPGAAVSVDDNNPCTTDSCNPTTGVVNAPNTASCEDGNACTLNDSCAQGACQPGAAQACNDNNPCTTDTCVPATGCAYTPNALPCSDNNACTAGDTCEAGACKSGAVVQSNDNNPCTTDSCDPFIGVINEPNNNPCNDNNACTTTDVCSGGACVGSGSVPCNDNNPCTTDSCNPASGCQSINNNAPCDDGDPCTQGDACSGGSCVGGANTCQCQNSGDCAAFEDGNSCNGTLVCQANQCVVNPATVVTCSGSAPVCQQLACNPTTGGCEAQPLGNGTPCNDGNACTSGDSCTAGACSGAPVLCQDNNPCTTDSCNPASGCTTAPATGPACNDGNACTNGDTCNNGSCVGGAAVVCNDGNPCTTDSCVPATGCATAPASGAACNDGNPCTNLDICTNGVCTSPGTPCDDSNACTVDTCVPGAGCNNAPVAANFCNDGNPCTTDTCVPATGCSNAPASGGTCSDGSACTTADVCTNGACVGGPALTCNDNNPCTTDSCNPATGCVFSNNNGAACSDNNLCTSGETCNAGACTGGSIPNCNDGNPCTTDSCNPATGCTTAPANGGACDDGDTCTLGDTCQAGQCKGGAFNPSCAVPGSVCSFTGKAGDLVLCPILFARESQATPLPATLEVAFDYSPFALQPMQFQDEICVAANCTKQSTPPAKLQPSGHSVVTTPAVALWPGSGVLELVHDTDAAAVLSDAYLNNSGTLVGNAQVVELQLMLVSDVPAGDAVGIFPSDMIAYSTTGAPMAVELVGGVLVALNELPPCNLYPEQCNDGIACTTDTCNASTGNCVYTANNAACNDGIACTTDSCSATTGCVFTPSNAVCNDNKPCTNDVCAVGVGCTNNPVSNGVPCDDGNACTTGDSCQAGSCAAGVPLVCDDFNDCTVDSCKVATGCSFAPQSGVPCSDGNDCTVGDSCGADGACKSGTPVSGPGCETDPGDVICQITGAAAAEVECAFKVISCKQTDERATAMQFTLTWDATQATIVNLYDDICFPVGCFPLALTGTGAQPMSTGHSVSIAPNPIGGWNGKPCTNASQCGGVACTGNYCVGTEAQGGFGAAVIVNLTNPSAVFSNAYFAGDGSVVGDPTIFRMRFKLKTAIPAGAPLEVFIDQLVVTDKTSIALEPKVQNFSLVTCQKKN